MSWTQQWNLNGCGGVKANAIVCLCSISFTIWHSTFLSSCPGSAFTSTFFSQENEFRGRTGRGELCKQTCARELGAEESVSKSNEEGDELEKSWSTGMQRTEVVKARMRAANRFFHVLAARLKL